MKKYIIGLITGLFIAISVMAFAETANEKIAQSVAFPLKVDGQNKELSSMYVIDNRTYVPLREFSDKMGYNIKWTDNHIDVITKINIDTGDDWKTFEVDGLYGFKDNNNNIIIQPQFDYAWEFHEGMAAVRKDGQYGYINTKGEVVIPYQFEYASDFENGVAWVREYNIIDGYIVFDSGSGPNYYIDKAGNKILEVSGVYDTWEFCEGYAVTTKFLNRVPPYLEPKPTSYSFINMRGEYATDMEFSGVTGGFTNGYAVVKQNNKWGVIDKEFKFVIECKYDSPTDVEESEEYQLLMKDN